MNRREIIILILAIVVALGLRLYFIPAPGYERDIQLFKIWSQTAAQYGVHDLYDKTWCDYQPAYLYVLKAIGSFYRVFYPGFDEHTYLFNFLIKLPAILADLIISIGLFLILRRKNTFNISLIAMAAYALNPVIILNSAYWGQIDSVVSLVAIGAILALVNNKFGWAWGLIAAGILIKVQLVILLPILILVTWKRKGFRALINSMSVSVCTLVLILLPFLYFHQVDRIIDRIFDAVGEYPHLSMNAFNVWWLFSLGKGRSLSDVPLFLGLFSYRLIGTLLLLVFMALLLRYLYYREKDEDAVFFTSFLSFFLFFMLPTQMHERYVMPAFIFLLFAAIRSRGLRMVYGILSITAFFNLLIVLFWAYPKNFPALPFLLKAFPADIVISLINTGLLIFMSYIIMKDIKLKYLAAASAAAIIIITGLYLLRPVQPVFLSDLTPTTYSQQWGKLRMDRSVEGNQLDVNGFIYTKGLGTHANSSIEFALGGRYRTLDGAVGLDDEQNRGNKIQAFIFADDKLIYQSGILQGWQKPRYFRVDISGAKELTLIINDGGDGINCDHADWLGIRVSP